MKILAFEPYYGGSHKAFIDGLSQASGHTWTVLTLPAHKWKWRMRHSAITFASEAAKLLNTGQRWELLFCSDMLNLAEFAALVPPELATLPKVVYFHENQLTYPVRLEDERDYQLAMTNLTAALAADAVWFNSQFHIDSFLGALEKFLKSMPDHQPLAAIEKIRTKSEVHPPGIGEFPARPARKPGPIRILWAGDSPAWWKAVPAAMQVARRSATDVTSESARLSREATSLRWARSSPSRDSRT